MDGALFKGVFQSSNHFFFCGMISLEIKLDNIFLKKLLLLKGRDGRGGGLFEWSFQFHSLPGDLEQSVSSAPSAQSRVPSHNCSKRMQVDPDMHSSSPNGHFSGLKAVSTLVSLPVNPSSSSSIKTSDSKLTNFAKMSMLI